MLALTLLPCLSVKTMVNSTSFMPWMSPTKPSVSEMVEPVSSRSFWEIKTEAIFVSESIFSFFRVRPHSFS